jgi:O-antigen/teichoic acid export membrane protein
MVIDKVESPAAAEAAHHASFFRQSGWLMIANIVGGMFMYGVHLLGSKVGKSEYGLFGTLLAAVMLIPGVPLQMVVTQQTARALAINRQREMAGIIRSLWLGLFGLWLVVSLIVLLFQNQILQLWGISNPAALWVTLPVVLVSLWAPIFQGTLQGQQNFFWLGWSMLANGFGRVLVAAGVVWVFHSGATGMMAGVLFGIGLAMTISVWHSRSLWQLAPLPFEWSDLLRQVIPLLLGFVFVQFLFTGDTMFVKHYFTEDETGSYVSAGTLSRALFWLVGPLASVMFPRIVHSAARSEQSNLMGLVLAGTLVLTVVGAAGLTLLGPWVVGRVYDETFVKVAAKVLPWYALAMVPLGLANVLVNSLLARSQFLVVPFIFLLAAGYAGTMVYINHLTHSLVTVLQVMGVFNFLLLAVCAWFTWGVKTRPVADAS